MKTTMTTLVFAAGLVAAPLTGLGAGIFQPDDVEPCINGGVSASGLFPAQALEDEYNARLAALTRAPCSIAGRAAPESFPTPWMGQAYAALAKAAANEC